MLLTNEKYEEIKRSVLSAYEETGISCLPIDPFEMAQKLYIVVKPYSSLSTANQMNALIVDPDGFVRVEYDSVQDRFNPVVYYNDKAYPPRIHFTLLHEIGHVCLGHLDLILEGKKLSAVEEAEADFFAKYAIAPPPLIEKTGCESPEDIQETFDVSQICSCNIFDTFQKWLWYGPKNYTDYEIRILKIFHAA